MKFSKVTKGLLIGAALAASSANADVLSSVEIDITNLEIKLFSDDQGQNQLQPAVDFGFIGDPIISFNGTSVSTTLNGNLAGDSYVTQVTDVFAPLNIDLDAMQTTPLSSVNSESSLIGNIFNPGGASGRTASYTDVGGYQTGETNSQISNSLEATFDFTAQQDVWLSLSFDWLFDVLVDITWSGGIGEADWAFEVDLIEKCTGFCAPTTLYTFDLNNDELFGISSSGSIVTDTYEFDKTGTQNSGLLSLQSDTAYQLKIVQNANTSGASVSEPMTLGIFALGLLGVAGYARRKA